MENKCYVVLGAKPWNRRIFDDIIATYPGEWHFIGNPAELSVPAIADLEPRYLFFMHWSWKVPPELVNGYECVCFHMTDVPYGRGGSPLQNLVVRGHRSTRLTALRMVESFDAGPVYMKEELSLEGGTAEEIYLRAAYLSAGMIKTIIEQEPAPQPQQGEPVIFKRRKPTQSRITDISTLESMHDFIRMLDADGYPNAFFEHGGFRFEFSRAVLYDGRIKADVIITPLEENE
jgi:methionyl-tRNA formyltransferase